MSLGQTMITAAFLVLLTIAVINANRLIANVDSSSYEKEALEQSGILANALLNEIVRKKFDSQADTSGSYQARSKFDAGMGAATNAKNYVNPNGVPDTYPYRSITTAYFDDADDYEGYIRSADAGNLTGFTLTVKVFYVSESNPNTKSNSQTYLKKIEVTVSNSKYLSKDVVYSTIMSY